MKQNESSLSVSCAQLSQAGVKDINEDSIGIRIPEGVTLEHKGIVSVIADGVSTAEAGREASQACVQNLLYDYYCTPETWTVQKSASQVLNALNRWLYSQGSHFQNAEKGYITTLSIIILIGDTAHLFHIGDSRIYRYRNNELEQLTRDHSRQVGKTTYLARAMGLDSKIEIDYRKEPLQKEDLFILTTDGIHDFYSSSKWAKNLDNNNLEEINAELHQNALANGSNDNLSSQVIKVFNTAPPAQDIELKDLADLPVPPELKKGQIIDGLTVLSTLCKSTRSYLYIVTDKKNNQQYVMKTPSPDYSGDKSRLDHFIMESWLGRRFRHNKLVKIISRDDEPSCLYFLMEYVPGVTLAEWKHKHTDFPVEKAVLIARQIGLGLRYLHRQQVVHQDLSPGNILIDDNEQIKLLDYGSFSISAKSELSKSIQLDGSIGDISYCAPECRLGKNIEAKADIFSLAAILFELITGKLPYNGKIAALTSEKQLRAATYVSATSINPYIPTWFDLSLKKAMSINPANRYEDIDEFIYDLEHPNNNLQKENSRPFFANNPLILWQSICSIECLVILAQWAMNS